MKNYTISLLSFAMIYALYSVKPIEGTNLSEIKTFFKGFIKNPKTVGAILPCSSYVAEEITKYFVNYINTNPPHTVHVLEVGAGTGSLTEIIAKIVKSHPDLTIIVDVVEISPDFCSLLEKKFGNNPNISIHCTSITDWKPAYSYDVIICTLPFNSLKTSLMRNIINHLKGLIRPEGIFSYVAYAGVTDIQKHFLSGKAKKEHLEKMGVLRALREQYQIGSKTILANFPPIWIYHLKIND